MTGEETFQALDLPGGLRLMLRVLGHGPLLILLHGFTGTGRSWGPEILRTLAGRFQVVALDLPGHGGSPVPGPTSLWPFHRVLESLAAVPRALGAEDAHWAGYSMGGRLGLAIAVEHPQAVSSLVLESAAPGLASAWERSERRVADEHLAAELEAQGIEAFTERWERLPIFASQSALEPAILAGVRAGRLAQDPMGLAWALRTMGTGSQPSYWESLSRLRCPATLVVGGLDEKFVAINRRMVDSLNTSHLEIVPGVGHRVHLEAPEEWLRLLEAALLDGPGGRT